MTDYKELIGKLRHYADTADENIYGICINAPEVMLQAADAIEQLVTEKRQANIIFVHKPTKSEFRRMAIQLGYKRVVHGHWIGGDYDKCSVCGYMELGRTDYCPNCGAKMDEVSE